MHRFMNPGQTEDSRAHSTAGRGTNRGFSTSSFLTIVFLVLAVALAVEGLKKRKAQAEQLEKQARDQQSMDFGFADSERLLAPTPKLGGASGLGSPSRLGSAGRRAGSSAPTGARGVMVAPIESAEEEGIRRIPPVSEEARESLLRMLPGGIEKKMRGLIDTSDERVREIEAAAEQ